MVFTGNANKEGYVKVLNCEQMVNINKADKEKILVSDGFFIIALLIPLRGLTGFRFERTHNEGDSYVGILGRHIQN